MLRRTITSELEGVYIGPSPATGFHYLDNFGLPTNTYSSSGANLIFQVPRATSFSYDVNLDRTRITSFGRGGNIANVPSSPPTVSLAFGYYNIGMIQESRLGMYVNFPDPITNQPVFSNTFQTCLISGFLVRENVFPEPRAYFPRDCRDCRNLFVAIAKNKEQLNYRTGDVDVIGFGNCYLTSYKTYGAVGQPPRTDVTYLGEHLRVDVSGKQFPSPAVDVKTYSGILDKQCSIPSGFNDFLPTVILPKDITLTWADGTSPLGVNLNSLAVQSYEIAFDLPREPLYNLGYQSPIDRTVRLPVPVTFSLDAFAADIQTGNLSAQFYQDKTYDLDLRLRVTRFATGDIYYYIRGAKFNGFSSANAVGDHRTVRMSFETELDPQDYSKGLFISGFLGLPTSGFIQLYKDNPIFNANQNFIKFDGAADPCLLLADNGDRILIENATPPSY